MLYIENSESISKNNELENEMTLDMSYFWYSDGGGWGEGVGACEPQVSIINKGFSWTLGCAIVAGA